MEYLEIFIAVAFFCLNSSMTRLFQVKIGKNNQSIRLYQSGYCLVGSIAYFLSGGAVKVSGMTLVLALAFGILFALASHLSSECMLCGPMSLTSLIMNLSLLIPLIYSFVFFDETIGSVRGIGVVLLLVTFALAAFSSSDKSKDGLSTQSRGRFSSVSLKWVILIFIGFLANGLTAVIQKIQQSGSAETGNAFLAIAYLVSAIYFTVLFFVDNKGEKVTFKGYYSSAVLLVMAVFLAGIGSYIGNGLLGTLSTKVDAALLYPSINGGLAIITAVVSFVFFREKINVKKLISLAIGVVAIILLNM